MELYPSAQSHPRKKILPILAKDFLKMEIELFPIWQELLKTKQKMNARL